MTLPGAKFPPVADADAILNKPSQAGQLGLFNRLLTGAFAQIDSTGFITDLNGGVTNSLVTLNSGDSPYVLSAADNFKSFLVESGVEIQCPTGLPYFTCEFFNVNSGALVTFSESGSTINSKAGSNPKMTGPNDYCQLISAGDDTFSIFGDLTQGDIPLLYPSCGLWVDFVDYLNVTDAVNNLDPIGSITDKGPESNNVTQVIGSNKPRIELGVLNGNAAAFWDGNDFFNLPGALNDITLGTNTIYAVAWKPTEVNNHYIVGGDNASESFGIETDSNEFRYRSWNQSTKDGTRVLTTPSIVVGVRDNTGMRIYNGLTQTGSTGVVASGTLSNCSLGSRSGTVGGWVGWISEVIIYRIGHDNDTRINITNYLKAKHAL